MPRRARPYVRRRLAAALPELHGPTLEAALGVLSLSWVAALGAPGDLIGRNPRFHAFAAIMPGPCWLAALLGLIGCQLAGWLRRCPPCRSVGLVGLAAWWGTVAALLSANPGPSTGPFVYGAIALLASAATIAHGRELARWCDARSRADA